MCILLKQSVDCDDYKVLTKIKQATAFPTYIYYSIETKSGPNMCFQIIMFEVV